MRKYIVALLLLFLASAPVQKVLAEEVEISTDYFETVDGENEEIHYDIYSVTTSDTTLPSSSPGAVKFNYIQGKTYQETSLGLQLIDFSLALREFSHNGITVKTLGDGSYSYTGTATNGVVNAWLFGSWNLDDAVLVLEPGTYYVKGVNLYVRNAGDVGKVTDDGSGKIFTINETTEYCGIRAMDAIVGKTYDDIVFPIIAKSSVPVEWEPYTGGATPNPSHPQELQSVVLHEIKITDDNGNLSSVSLSEPIELNGIGSVRDEIRNGQLIQRVGVVKLNSLNYSYNSACKTFDCVFTDYLLDKGVTCLSNRYLSISNVDGISNLTSKADYTICLRGSYANRLYIKDSDYTDGTMLKNSFSDDDVLYYLLAEPVVTDLPTVDQLALGKLETFQGTCYLSFDSAISPVFQLEYSSFVKKIYDNSLEKFVEFMGAIFDFVATEFTIWGFTFSYWHVIVLSCLASIIGAFVSRLFE